jgi:hypothetical protein
VIEVVHREAQHLRLRQRDQVARDDGSDPQQEAAPVAGEVGQQARG